MMMIWGYGIGGDYWVTMNCYFKNYNVSIYFLQRVFRFNFKVRVGVAEDYDGWFMPHLHFWEWRRKVSDLM